MTIESLFILLAMIYAGGIVLSLTMQHDQPFSIIRTLTEAWVVMLAVSGTVGMVYVFCTILFALAS